MENTKKYLAAAVALSGMLASAAPLAAQGVGYVGLTFALDDAKNVDDNDQATIKSFTIDGAYAHRFGTGNTLVFEGKVRDVDYTNVFSGPEMQEQFQIGAHYLRDMGSNMKLGGFLAYGEAPHGGTDEDYKLIMAGAEIIYEANSNLILFGQLGVGDSPENDNLSSAGFDNGSMGRVGLIYTGLERTELTFEAEIAGSARYEDDSEPGAFYSIGLKGQTSLAANGNLVATYGLRHSFFDARSDDDDLRENTIHVGVRYIFGGANKPGDLARAGIIGLPYTPLRASAWTPVMD